jgi:hypothetical protein
MQGADDRNKIEATIPLEPGSNNEKHNTIIENSDDEKPEPETDDEGQTLLF